MKGRHLHLAQALVVKGEVNSWNIAIDISIIKREAIFIDIKLAY